MTEIINYIETHWLAGFFTLIATLATYFYGKLILIAKSTIQQNEAVAEGVQAILRSEIIDKYNYYKDKGYCPIYAKENLKRLYRPYQNLGGNGVIEKLVDELLALPTERIEKS